MTTRNKWILLSVWKIDLKIVSPFIYLEFLAILELYAVLTVI